jgi:hypothetical protein
MQNRQFVSREEMWAKHTPLKNFAIGTLAGSASNAISFFSKFNWDASILNGGHPAVKAHFLKRIVTPFGVSSAIQGGQFCIKELVKKYLPHRNPETQFLQFSGIQFLAGAITASIILPISYPLTSMSNMQKLDQMYDFLKNRKAFLSVYERFGISLPSQMCYRAIYFGMFDTLMTVSHDRLKLHESQLLREYIFAHLTTLTAVYFVSPFETVRNKRFKGNFDPEVLFGGREPYLSSWACFKDILKTHGWKSLYRVDQVFRRTFGPAVMLVIFEEMKRDQ